MTDTARTWSALIALLADNTTGDISAQDVRDLVKSLQDPVTDGFAPDWDLLFTEDCSDISDWSQQNGTWSVSSGRFLQANTASTQAMLTRTATYDFGEVTKLQTTIRWPTSGAGGGTQYGGFVAEAVSGSGYSNGMTQMFMGRTNGGARSIYIDDGSNAWSKTPAGSFALDTDYVLKLIVFNWRIAHFYIDGTFVGQAPLGNRGAFFDTVAIGSRDANVAFDDISVYTLPYPI
jgi:hypothetical protein